MTKLDTTLLKAAAVWTVFVWAVFLRNLLFGDTDRAVAFKIVHSALAVVSLGFAGVIWTVAARSRRRADDRVGTPS